MENKGLIHIYYGDGKGKTTAAIGQAVRMAGYDQKVLFARFLKNESSGELKVLDKIEGIDVLHLKKSFGFYRTLNEEEKVELHKTYRELWRTIQEKVQKEDYQLLVMDEFLHALNYALVEEKEALEFLKNKPERLEVVLTGRDPSEQMIEAADYASEIRKIKHPYDRGIIARKGIEY